MKMKRIVCIAAGLVLLAGCVTGCGSAKEKDEAFDTSKSIAVFTREGGSGTRGAFVELFKVQKDENGKLVDAITPNAVTNNATNVIMTSVSGDTYAMSYLSLGSVNDTIKALSIDGVAATTDNVKNGSYKIARPFLIATKGTPNAQSQDFINYIISTEGQKIISDGGYIPITDTKAYSASSASGKVVIAGSSSVSPIMQKLIEAYKKVNTNVTVELQESDSSAGMTAAINGACDIGMSSRDLKDSEKSDGLKEIKIATDGIAVIVNKNCTMTNITSEKVKDIFMGTITKWSDAQ